MSLEKKGAYILKKVKDFSVPVIASRLNGDTKDFFKGLSILSMVISKLSIIYNDNLKRKGRIAHAPYERPLIVAAHDLRMHTYFEAQSQSLIEFALYLQPCLLK